VGRGHPLEEFRERLRDPDPAVRAYYLGKLMRQAKPDDVFTFPWTLSGGAALAGFHTAHRETRDLDLFWQRSRELGDAVRTVFLLDGVQGSTRTTATGRANIRSSAILSTRPRVKGPTGAWAGAESE
jgi:hypothetical protein